VRILIELPTWLGDAVMASAAVEAIPPLGSPRFPGAGALVAGAAPRVGGRLGAALRPRLLALSGHGHADPQS